MITPSSTSPVSAQPPYFDLLAGQVPDWLASASPDGRLAWHAALEASLASSSAADTLMQQVLEPVAFVEPLLAQALRSRFNRQVDVGSAQLWRLQRHKELTGNVPLRYVGEAQTARTKVTIAVQTLVDAAMANFEPGETTQGAFQEGSAVLEAGAFIPFDEYGQGPWYDPARLIAIAPHEFASICRELDLGARYQRHLQGILGTPHAHATLLANAADDMRLHAESARLRQWLSEPAYAALLGSLQMTGGSDQWHGHPVQACELRLLGSLSQPGIALQRAVLLQANLSGQDACVLYLPGDPQHPVREYDSLQACADHLRERLRQPAFLAYFMGLMALAERADFAQRLRNTLTPLPFWALNPGDEQRASDPQADLKLRAYPQSGPLLPWWTRRQVAAALADARGLVVPNEDEDRQTREARLMLWQSVGINAANLAGFFVPGLGVVLLGALATQLLGDLVVGVDEWQHSQHVQALAHFKDIAQTVASVAVAAGAAWVIRPAPLLETLRPLRNALGQTQLVSRSRWVVHHQAVARWNAQASMRRLGTAVDGLDDLTLQRLQRSTQLSDADLRDLHRQQRPLPALLREALADAQAQRRVDESSGSIGFAAARLAPPVNESQAGKTLRRDFGGLPVSLAEEIVEGATAPERRLLIAGRVPLRQAEQAHRALRDWRLQQAIDGLWLPATARADSALLIQGLRGHLPELADGEPEALRHAVHEYAANHLDQAAAVLGQQRWLPWLRPPVRRANGLLGYPLSGRGAPLPESADAAPRTVAERLRVLYPQVHDAHFNQLLEELGADPQQAIQLRELEYQALTEQLQQWSARSSEWIDSQGVRRPVAALDRHWVAQDIRAAWRRETSVINHPDHDSTWDLDLSGRQIGSLPVLNADFSHIQTLALADMGLHGDPSGFLSGFARVTVLELQGNALTRIPHAVAQLSELTGLSVDENPLLATAQMFEPLRQLTALEFLVMGDHPVPPPLPAVQSLSGMTQLREIGLSNVNADFTLEHWQALQALPHLERLWLGNNRLVLTPQMLEVIASMQSLEVLDLHLNPLGLAPDVSRLHALQMLDLRSCGLSQWPPGLTELMALPGGPLRSVWLQHNPIVQLPELAPLAFFRRPLRSLSLSPEHLDAASTQRLDSALRINSRQANLGLQGLPGESGPSWLAGASPALRDSVQALRGEPQARNFLEALDRAEDMASFQRDPVAGRERAQRLVQAITEPAAAADVQGSTHLRAAFFDLGEEAMTTCGDGLQLLMNRCEALLLVFRASAQSASAAAPLQPLLELARSMLRAELVDEAAMQVARGRYAWSAARNAGSATADALLSPLDDPLLAAQPLATDEAEVRLRFRLDLQTRLQLPPQGERMRYPQVTSAEQLDRVQAYVEERMSDQRLRDWLVDQAWWRDLLARRSPEALSLARQPWLQGQQYLYELSREGTSLPTLAPEVQARLAELYPDRVWAVGGVSQRVALSAHEDDTLRQVLLAGQAAAEMQAYARLTAQLVG